MKVKLDPFDPLALILTGTIGKVVTDLAALIKLLWALLAALPSHAHWYSHQVMPPQDLVHVFVGGDVWSAWIDIQKRHRNLTWGTLTKWPGRRQLKEDPLNERTEVSTPCEAS